MTTSEQVQIIKGKTGNQKGKWRGKVYAKNGKLLVTTSEKYCNRKECVKALKSAAHIVFKFYGY